MRTQVHLTTSYASGALVLGATRRDRGVLVTFSAGDFLYSIGHKGEADKIKEVRVGATGPWTRERHLAGSHTEVNHRFAAATASFLLEAHVRGPCVVVTIDGMFVTSYATPDGSPIRGPIGFAMEQGAVRLQTPTVERVLDGDDEGRGLDLEAPSSDGFQASRDRKLGGVVATKAGTVIVYVPARYTKRAQLQAADLTHILEPLVSGLTRDVELRCGIVVALPAALGQDLAPAARSSLTSLGVRASVVLHAQLGPAEEEPMIGFVDGLGVLRVTMQLEPGMGVFGRVGTWARRWRAH